MKSKWVALLLLVSLALNFALVGYLIGKESRGGPRFDPTRDYPRWARGLPDERRDALRPIIREHFRGTRPQYRALRNHHDALRQAITANPFDAASLETVLSNMRDAHQKAQQSSHASFVEFVRNLSVAEREKLAADLARPRRSGRPHTDGNRQ